MSIRDILGLYGPNRREWGRATYEHIERSRVRWVVWRTDSDPDAPHQLYTRGLRVIAQAPDRYGDDAWVHPGLLADRLYSTMSTSCLPGTPVVVDNEPQRHPDRTRPWFAEQYTRYLRAVHGYWRWHDPGSLYPLVAPALASGPDRHGALWHRTAAEPEAEADGQGLHAYWETPEAMAEPDFGHPWELLDQTFMASRPQYILEYGRPDPAGHEPHLAEYERWLRALPPEVQCACLYILDPTDDWRQWAITEPVLDWLARLED